MWDLRYRPLKFGDVLGQQGSVQVLKARLRNGTALDTNYIFSGGPGQGKTTLARILARSILCQNLDKENPEPCNECDNCQAVLNDNSNAFTERDAASQGTIDHMRGIVDDLPFAVFGAVKRVYLFDECHRMSKDAQDVLLKPLEEKRMLGLFCTTEPEKIRGAIRSRCEEYQIRKVTREDILGRMKMVLTSEKVEHEEDGVLIVIDFCGGHVRDVLNKLEMIAQMGPVTVESARAYLNLSVISTYYEILLALTSDTKTALTLIDKACERVTPEEVASGLAEAAMNSFRLANNMMADFAFADRVLGQKVYDIFGQQTVKIAEFFLRSRYSTQVGLICDTLTLAQDFGAGGIKVAPTYAPPVMTPLHAPSAAPQLASQAPPAATAPKVQVSAPAPAAPLPKGVRADGIGNRGSDPLALTDLDVYAVASKLPKGQAVVPLQFGNDTRTASDGRKPISNGEWKRAFQERWLSSKGVPVANS